MANKTKKKMDAGKDSPNPLDQEESNGAVNKHKDEDHSAKETAAKFDDLRYDNADHIYK